MSHKHKVLSSEVVNKCTSQTSLSKKTSKTLLSALFGQRKINFIEDAVKSETLTKLFEKIGMLIRMYTDVLIFRQIRGYFDC